MKPLGLRVFRRYGVIYARIVLLGFLLYGLFFMLVPFRQMIIDKSKTTDTAALQIVMYVGVGLISLLIIVDIIRLIVMMIGRLIILKDVVRDKNIVTKSHGDNEVTYYYLYFDQIFGKFKRQISVSRRVYRSVEINKSYYLGILRNRVISDRIRSADEYELVGGAKKLLVDSIEEVRASVNWKWQPAEECPNVDEGGVKRITPEQIIDDIAKFTNVRNIEVVSAGYLFQKLVQGGNNAKLRQNVEDGNYKIVPDEVVAVEEHENISMLYRFIHELKPIRLKSGRTLGLRRTEFNNLKPGDKLYVVYLDIATEREKKDIIAVYQQRLAQLASGFMVSWSEDEEESAKEDKKAAS